MKEAELKAYARGYHYGLDEGAGCPDSYLDEGEDALRHLFKRGYDAGVAEYSAFVLAEIINQEGESK